MSDTTFYLRQGHQYVAQRATTGPWDARLQHGGPVAALLGSRVEREAQRSAGHMRLAHFALDFLSPVPVATLDVVTENLRPGKKIALWSSRASVGGREAARVTAWMVAAEDGRSPEAGSRPAPPMPASASPTFFESLPNFPYGDALEWRFTEGAFDQIGPSTLWARLRVSVVEGEPVTPLQRVLAMVDSANGASAELDVARWLFVPVNLTVSLHRQPVGEWTGMEVSTAIAPNGVGTTRGHLFDEAGSIGEALQTLYVEKR